MPTLSHYFLISLQGYTPSQLREFFDFLIYYSSYRPITTIVVGSILFLILITFLLNVFIYSVRFGNDRREIRKNRLFDLWSPILFAIMDEDDEPDRLVRLVKKKDREIFTEFLLFYLENLKGADIQALKKLARESGVLGWEQEQLCGARSPWRRALAAFRLGQLRAHESRKELVEALNESYSAVCFNAAGALLKIGDKESLQQVIDLLLNSDLLTEELFSELLIGYGNEVADELTELLAHYKKLPLSRLRIIKILGYLNGIQAGPVLFSLFKQSRDDEERINIVKALGRLGQVEYKDSLLPFLKSKNPVLRSQTAKTLGAFGDPSAIPYLVPLIEDRDWWCRFYSVNAISQLGEEGQTYLRKFMLRTRDAFSKDMIQYALAGSS